VTFSNLIRRFCDLGLSPTHPDRIWSLALSRLHHFSLMRKINFVRRSKVFLSGAQRSDSARERVSARVGAILERFRGSTVTGSDASENIQPFGCSQARCRVDESSQSFLKSRRTVVVQKYLAALVNPIHLIQCRKFTNSRDRLDFWIKGNYCLRPMLGNLSGSDNLSCSSILSTRAHAELNRGMVQSARRLKTIWTRKSGSGVPWGPVRWFVWTQLELSRNEA
jgi:hypothetical protein